MYIGFVFLIRLQTPELQGSDLHFFCNLLQYCNHPINARCCVNEPVEIKMFYDLPILIGFMPLFLLCDRTVHAKLLEGRENGLVHSLLYSAGTEPKKKVTLACLFFLMLWIILAYWSVFVLIAWL